MTIPLQRPEFSLVKEDRETPITNLDESWVTRGYEAQDIKTLCAHFKWDVTNTPQGTLYLEYSGDSIKDNMPVTVYEIYNTVTLDGVLDSQMFLDANLPVATFRFRYEYISGSGDFILNKIMTKP